MQNSFKYCSKKVFGGFPKNKSLLVFSQNRDYRTWKRIHPKEWSKLFVKHEFDLRMKTNNMKRTVYSEKFTRAEERGEYDAILHYWNELKVVHNITPSNDNYNTVISIFARKGDLETANMFFDEFKAKRPTKPTAATYTTLLKLCLEKDLERAKQLYTMMCEQGINLPQITHKKLLEDLKEKGIASR